MEKNFEYLGHRVRIAARQTTVPESHGLWLANIWYARNSETKGDEQWVSVDRGAQNGYVDPDSAIEDAEHEIRTILSERAKGIR